MSGAVGEYSAASAPALAHLRDTAHAHAAHTASSIEAENQQYSEKIQVQATCIDAWDIRLFVCILSWKSSN